MLHNLHMSRTTAPHIHVSAEASPADFFALLKPKVMSLVVFTGLAGLWVAPGLGELHPFLALVALLCIALGAGAAGAFNMWYDRDIDAVMKRTESRPLPAGRLDPEAAMIFAVLTSVASITIMGLALNWTAAALLAFASLFYIFIYTIWLKRKTPQNIVIGGAAGAFPPLIGWASVTGEISLYPFIMFAIIFFWTPPHFWALSLFSNEDYKRAGIPMLNVVHGVPHTKWQMLLYTIILLPLSLSPYFLGFASVGYLITAGALSLLFIISALRVYRYESLRHARQMFGYSVFYLFALFLAVMAFSY